ncbi:MAG TPA: hypothetical protein VGF53_17585 [Pseudolabrys sp.]|jgi:hypothetical protein
MQEQQPGQSVVRRSHVLPAVLAAVLLAAIAVFAVPQAFHAFAGMNDPDRAVDNALDGKLDSSVATREINGALASGDADLAQSFVALAAERHVTLDPALTDAVKAASGERRGRQRAAQGVELRARFRHRRPR